MQRSDALTKAALLDLTKEAGFLARQAPKAKMFLKGLGSGFANAGKAPAARKADQIKQLRDIVNRSVSSRTPTYSMGTDSSINAKQLAKQLMPSYRLGQSSAVPGALLGTGALAGAAAGAPYNHTSGMKRMSNIAENVPLFERLRYLVDPGFLNSYISGDKPLPY